MSLCLSLGWGWGLVWFGFWVGFWFGLNMIVSSCDISGHFSPSQFFWMTTSQLSVDLKKKKNPVIGWGKRRFSTSTTLWENPFLSLYQQSKPPAGVALSLSLLLGPVSLLLSMGFYWFGLWCWGMEHRAWLVLSRHSTTELYPHPLRFYS